MSQASAKKRNSNERVALRTRFSESRGRRLLNAVSEVDQPSENDSNGSQLPVAVHVNAIDGDNDLSSNCEIVAEAFAKVSGYVMYRFGITNVTRESVVIARRRCHPTDPLDGFYHVTYIQRRQYDVAHRIPSFVGYYFQKCLEEKKFFRIKACPQMVINASDVRGILFNVITSEDGAVIEVMNFEQLPLHLLV